MALRSVVLLVGVLALTAGCSSGRHSLTRAENQAVCVQSGDRWFLTLEENATTGYRWETTSDDPDVEVSLERHPPADPEVCGAPGEVEAIIRIHRGYDGPSTVVFSYRRPWEKKPIRQFTLSLFKRTGDVAFWE